jgi:hypothetical protein
LGLVAAIVFDDDRGAMDTSANLVEMTNGLALPSQPEARRPRRHRATKPKLISRSQIDQRSQAYKVFDRIVGDVTADLGGRDQVSAVEAALIESFAGVVVMLDDMNVRTLLGEKPDPFVYCQVASTLTRIASRLGLQRRARDVGTSLADVVAEHVREAQQP